MNTKAQSPEDYLHIAAWGRQLGSHQYYIENQQKRAFETGAPVNAIYEEHGTGRWVTVDECVPGVTTRINEVVEILRAKVTK